MPSARRPRRDAHPAPEPLPKVRAALQAVVTRESRGLRVKRKWATDWYIGHDLVYTILGYSRHLSLEFRRGASLPDPAGILEGTGKFLRHVKVRSTADARAPALARLIRAAIALDATLPERAW